MLSAPPERTMTIVPGNGLPFAVTVARTSGCAGTCRTPASSPAAARTPAAGCPGTSTWRSTTAAFGSMEKLPFASVTAVRSGFRTGSSETHRVRCSSEVSRANADTLAPRIARPSLPTTVPVIAPQAANEKKKSEIARNAALTPSLLRHHYIMPDLHDGGKGRRHGRRKSSPNVRRIIESSR